MVNRIALIAVVLTCIAPIGGLVIFASSSGEEPSAQFLAAGMKDQERPGMAIRVTYEYTDEVEYAPGVEVEHPMSTVTTRGVYVRTQGVVALRETEVRTYKNGSVAETITKSSYNRATGEFRQLTETDTGKYGIIASTKPLPGHVLTIMSSMTRYDPLFSGAETPVSRLVEDGTVMGREAVGGKDCWKTELCSGKECDQKDLVWVDPEVGFNPRRIDIVGFRGSSEKGRFSVEFSDYQQVAEGVWFPMKHSTRLIKGGSTAESHEYAVKSVDYYKAPSPEELSVQFPSGTRVKLMDDGTEIVIP